MRYFGQLVSGSQPSLVDSQQIRLTRISEPYSVPPARFQRASRKGWLGYEPPSERSALLLPWTSCESAVTTAKLPTLGSNPMNIAIAPGKKSETV
ncbi:unnamed protein product [Lasius platythorax]|uniref:Uncharacterized protein n=1 Tax=Lasius platythorax TaxID=488582 RepID=A0AAV2NXY5_9HYME